ncbi:MAG: hypothetical protein SNJ63_01430, partial [Sphingomonadaceae bacterium]
MRPNEEAATEAAIGAAARRFVLRVGRSPMAVGVEIMLGGIPGRERSGSRRRRNRHRRRMHCP